MEKVTVEVTVNVICAQAWKFFTEPKHVTKWNSASSDWHCPRAVNNLMVGGIFNYRMESSDGNEDFDFEGMYSEVVPLKLIAYTIADGRKVRVEFSEGEGSTHIIETFDPEDENPIEMQRNGWQLILNNFKTYVETQDLE